MRCRLLCLFIFSIGTTVHAGLPPRIKFIENKNQWPSHVLFYANINGGTMSIEPGGFRYYFLDEKRLEELHEQTHFHYSEADGQKIVDDVIRGNAVHVNFIGSNRNSIPMSFGQSSEYYNYFLGDDEKHWASKAFAYDGFIYPSLYSGVDMKVYSSGEHAKYDFIVAPGADPSPIIIEYLGAKELSLENGNLYARTDLVDIIEQRPLAYQIINGKKINVDCEFRLSGKQLSFSFPQGYDACYELVIDPLLIFSTYSGSTADNWGSSATPGEKGNLYSTGVTNHNNVGGFFPATPGVFQTTYGGIYDVSILKYNSAGDSMLYATFLGGKESESPHSLIMNADKELMILGTTSSKDFPVSVNAYDTSFNGGTLVDHVLRFSKGSDIFIARISTDGSQLLSSTFLGGKSNDGLNSTEGVLTKNYGDELRGDIITDEAGNVYISSVTQSSDFPAINSFNTSFKGGETDAIVLKFNKQLSQLQWSAFLGGDSTDAAHTIKLTLNNDIYIAGGTASIDFPTTTGSYQKTLRGEVDGWIAKIKNNGSKIDYATYTGTSSFDQIYFLDLNSDEEVYVYGQTSGEIPITSGVFSNPGSGQFVQKFNSDLSKLVFSTVFGSGIHIPNISPTAFLVNECNNLYMTGWGGGVNIERGFWQSSTTGMTTTSDAYQKTTSGSDFYFIVLTADASDTLYATYLGGDVSLTHVDGGTSRFDKGGIVYHAVCSGCRLNRNAPSTSDFPTTPTAWSRINKSGNCNNAAFKFDLSSLKARLQTNSIKLDMPGLNKICFPDSIVFQNLCTGGEFYEWDFGDGTPPIVKTNKKNITYGYKSTGKYTVTLTAIDETTCIGRDVATTVVDVFTTDTQVQDNDDLCLGTPYSLFASGGDSYFWESEDPSFPSDLAEPSATPKDTTWYYVTITESNGCIHQDSVLLNVIPTINPKFELIRLSDCIGRPFVQVKNQTDSLLPGNHMFFDFGDGVTSENEEQTHKYEQDGLYFVKLVGVNEFCVSEKIVPTPVFTLMLPNVITPSVKEGDNDVFSVQYGQQPEITPNDFGYKVSLSIFNRWGNKVFETEDYQYDWSGEGLAPGVYYYEVTIEGHATCKSWLHILK
ncbi:MAG: PKD domain-containing protein [Chryseolinea sp.]